MAATTRYPVVLVHGLFGFGKQRPLWNTFAPYWPEKEIAALNPNTLIVDVGAVSSDHDRACELFYELYGGTVDYGEAHARHTQHARYGPTYDRPLHPTWSAHTPVHLVGHSMGATTAIELYQLICQDYFHVGSDYRWVRSITCIAGPLTGSTLSHMLSLHGDEMTPYTGAHLLSSLLSVYYKLYHAVPMLRGLFDLRMEQWDALSIYDAFSVANKANASLDLAIHSCQPARRIVRNSQLTHMDKVYLMSITTSPRYFKVSKREIGVGLSILLLVVGSRSWLPQWIRSRRSRAGVVCILLLWLWRRARRWNFAQMPSMFALAWLMRRRARSLHTIYNGFDPEHWQHNDGAVNIHSMLRPWFPKPQELLVKSRSGLNLTDGVTSAIRKTASTVSLKSSSSSSSLTGNMASSMSRCLSHISIDGIHRETSESLEEDEHVDTQRFERGRWYVYRVDSNHLAGTFWDREAGDLYKSLFMMIIDEYEQEPEDVLVRPTAANAVLPKTLNVFVRDVDAVQHQNQAATEIDTPKAFSPKTATIG